VNGRREIPHGQCISYKSITAVSLATQSAVLVFDPPKADYAATQASAKSAEGGTPTGMVKVGRCVLGKFLGTPVGNKDGAHYPDTAVAHVTFKK
jgi:hypothetical protein